MNGISFEDGMKILDAARQELQSTPAAPPSATAPHQSVLSEAQAHAWQLMMLITGQTGDTVGRGGLHNHSTEGAGNGIRQEHRQVGGSEGDGDGSGVVPPGASDPGPDGSRVGQQQGVLNGGQEGAPLGELNQAPGTASP